MQLMQQDDLAEPALLALISPVQKLLNTLLQG